MLPVQGRCVEFVSPFGRVQKVLESEGREIGQLEDFSGDAASTKKKQIKDPHPPKPP